VSFKPPAIQAGWKSTVTRFELNELGFRGQPVEYADEDLVVLLLGDSQVEAPSCAYAWMPERRLQHYLGAGGRRVKVFTAGTLGYGQDQELLALQEYYAKHRADLVALWLTPNNDVWNNLFPTHWPANGPLKPTFWLEGEELRGPTFRMGEPVAASALRLVALWRRAFRRTADWDGQWEKRLPAPYQPMKEYSGPVDRSWQERWDVNREYTRGENLDNEKSHMAIMLTPRSARMEYGLALTRRLLGEIDQLVRNHGGKLVIFRVVTPAELATAEEAVHVLNGRYYRVSRRQLQANVADMTKGLAFVEVPVTETEWRTGPSDVHLNEHATDEAMRNLAERLQEYVPSPARP